MKNYVRLTAKVGADSKIERVWAVDLGVRNGWQRFSVVARDGEPKNRIILGKAGSPDWVKIEPARMNNHYAELEVIP